MHVFVYILPLGKSLNLNFPFSIEFLLWLPCYERGTKKLLGSLCAWVGLADWLTSLSASGTSGNLQMSLLEVFSGMLDFSGKDLLTPDSGAYKPGCLRARWQKGAGGLHIYIWYSEFFLIHIFMVCTVPVFWVCYSFPENTSPIFCGDGRRVDPIVWGEDLGIWLSFPYFSHLLPCSLLRGLSPLLS